MDEITSFTGEYHFLSNFYPSPFVWQGNVYPTNEHFYQAAKAINELMQEKIRLAATPGLAKKLGRQVPLPAHWEADKERVMLLGLMFKFTQNADLRKQLLATGDALLEEGNNYGDKYWGTVNRMGLNRLGKLLMNVRSYLRDYDKIQQQEKEKLTTAVD